eukprot:7333599-Pyramimonas_sp.AAC.1
MEAYRIPMGAYRTRKEAYRIPMGAYRDPMEAYRIPMEAYIVWRAYIIPMEAQIEFPWRHIKCLSGPIDSRWTPTECVWVPIEFL